MNANLKFLADKFEQYLRESGLTDADVGNCIAACEPKNLDESLKRVAEEIVAKCLRQNPALRVVIDTDIDPQLPACGSGLKIEKHARVGKVVIEKRPGGLYIGGKKFVLRLLSRQVDGNVDYGYAMLDELGDQPVLSASFLDFFLDHPEFYPEELKKDADGHRLHAYFWGTEYKGENEELYIRYLCWDGTRLLCSHDWLGTCFNNIRLAAATE